jgi:hypothetical protein
MLAQASFPTDVFIPAFRDRGHRTASIAGPDTIPSGNVSTDLA